jgi:hypothetical protein
VNINKKRPTLQSISHRKPNRIHQNQIAAAGEQLTAARDEAAQIAALSALLCPPLSPPSPLSPPAAAVAAPAAGDGLTVTAPPAEEGGSSSGAPHPLQREQGQWREDYEQLELAMEQPSPSVQESKPRRPMVPGCCGDEPSMVKPPPVQVFVGSAVHEGVRTPKAPLHSDESDE